MELNPVTALIALLVLLLAFLFQIVWSALFFPLPVGDTSTVRYRTIPSVTLLLVITNVVLYFAWQLPSAMGGDIYDYNRLIYTYGFRATTIWNGYSIGAFTTFTAMFMHADPGHLIGNMFFLWTYGRRVEDACGSWRFLLFYIFAGMVAHLGSALLNPGIQDVPAIGASGAISGVLGAFLILFPTARISCLWGLGSLFRVPLAALGFIGDPKKEPVVWKWTVLIPAWILLVYFAVWNFFPSIDIITQGSEAGGGVNYLAHLMGFLAAVGIVFFVRKDLLSRLLAGRVV